MKTLKVKWTGIRPLVMSNPQTIKLSNEHATTSRKLGAETKAARKKGDEDKLARLESEMAKNDWTASAYYDQQQNVFFIPDTVLLACIRSGATANKRGRDIDRAVIVNETEAVIGGITRHKTMDAYYDDPAFKLEGPAKIPPKTGALIWKTRCMMPTGWTVEFSIDFEETLIEKKTLIEIMECSGRLSGIGGWRPKFGRFLVEVI